MKNTLTPYLFFLALLLGSLPARTQYTRTIISAGYGTYQLDSYREFQNNMITKGIPFEGVKAVDLFPNYFNWMVAQEYIFNPIHSAALEFAYLYTGGRNHLADYSGEYALDMQASNYKLGMSFSTHNMEMLGIKNLNGFLRLRAGWSRSFFKLREQLNIYDTNQQNQELNFFSNSFYLEFGPGLVYNLTPYISLRFSAGYEYEKEAQLKNTEFKKASLSNQDQGYVRTNWSGIRMRAGIGIDMVSLLRKRN